MRFEVAPLDEYASRVTIGLAYLGGLLMLPLLFAYLANLRWGGLLVAPALALPLALFMLLSYAAQPGAYLIEDADLVVRRRWWRPLRVPLDTITGAAAATFLADVPRRGLRFAFNPGVFGYLGPFRLEPYGQTFFLATDRSRLVSVARDGQPPLILSPARPRQFVEALNERRAQAAMRELAVGEPDSRELRGGQEAGGGKQEAGGKRLPVVGRRSSVVERPSRALPPPR